MCAGIAKQFAARHPDMPPAPCTPAAYSSGPAGTPGSVSCSTRPERPRNGPARTALPGSRSHRSSPVQVGGLSWADVADALASTETVKFYWEAWIL